VRRQPSKLRRVGFDFPYPLQNKDYMKLPLRKIEERRRVLYNHPLLNNDKILCDITSLQMFMERHVYAVWDFMSLLKTLQHEICPSTTCWVPNKWIRSGLARTINDIVTGEESDIDIDGIGTISHHDLYAQAMLEIGADGREFESFIQTVTNNGFRYALENASVPYPSRRFMEKTFKFIETGKPHVVAAAFCFGRETSIPTMFTNIANTLNLVNHDCPKFHYYLQRHIELDGDEHGPASIYLVETLCEHDPVKIHEAEQAALEAIDARIEFWDAVLEDITTQKDYWRHE
jgi:hypothetical protein